MSQSQYLEWDDWDNTNYQATVLSETYPPKCSDCGPVATWQLVVKTPKVQSMYYVCSPCLDTLTPKSLNGANQQ